MVGIEPLSVINWYWMYLPPPFISSVHFICCQREPGEVVAADCVETASVGVLSVMGVRLSHQVKSVLMSHKNLKAQDGSHGKEWGSSELIASSLRNALLLLSPAYAHTAAKIAAATTILCYTNAEKQIMRVAGFPQIGRGTNPADAQPTPWSR